MEIKEAKELLEKYSKEDFEFGKLEKYLLNRIKATKEEVVEDLFSLKNLKFVEKQRVNKELRYALFYVYSKRKGRVYIITIRDRLRVITAYPLGRKTLSKYNKKRFKNLEIQ
ncbi:hypothetical protein COU62_02715 [Candidatus Pacearchaeota archaeon CG10_big_fil_rev_8_21_14_0_10_35_219]|nr:hypothetical protein [Candidatus Pacearchaeota archaeon]OIO43319.1 MAG: hypothetical protein AUJ63_00290 [Candidatus Pacearchaeota archaeon CG1_02_35_32]PIO07751.1 MAG: hypothetical protein COU62_02715 [Candidatus Pacearchaeota archaeon CG10_big_fil_rev_8_21_14_0_10_35_219]PIY81467.1 MAG: hypothetical protein COY79_01870 [Candidatus Pacearchaeota archaeon CG_4_10_14_0_8_um_filter_35_169]PIZ80447.1 MAG: hypothetical protein COY00_01250 [Candidatus Pacearchaeota archaeon CG_4_10_14_0_2_um_filt